jgi:hypothetical protein
VEWKTGPWRRKWQCNRFESRGRAWNERDDGDCDGERDCSLFMDAYSRVILLIAVDDMVYGGKREEKEKPPKKPTK